MRNFKSVGFAKKEGKKEEHFVEEIIKAISRNFGLKKVRHRQRKKKKQSLSSHEYFIEA